MRPISPPKLVEEVVALIAARPGRVRVAVDGADALNPAGLADALVNPLQLHGRPALRVRAEDHLRPASLRFERGRTDPDSYYEDWLDEEGLLREVLRPLEPGGTGRIRPLRWDAAANRARREGFVEVPADGVVVLSGPLLLGRGLPLDLSVHLAASASALLRRTPAEAAWTLPAHARYVAEVTPESWADVVVRMEDPRHPALARP